MIATRKALSLLAFIIIPWVLGFQNSRLVSLDASTTGRKRRWPSSSTQIGNGIGSCQHQHQLAASSNLTHSDGPQSAETTGASTSSRRSVLMFGMMGLASPYVVQNQNNEANAAVALPGLDKKSSNKLFFVNPDKNASDSLQLEQVDLGQIDLNSELCLLKLLPVKNPVFRGLERSVIGVSSLRKSEELSNWKKVQVSLLAAIDTVDTKRGRLEPIFNPEEDTMIQIIKGERGEQRIEAFREQLVELANATSTRNVTRSFQIQKKALLALSEVGEFLVPGFPYDVPTEGLFSYLPRLSGRAKVTFSIRRRNKVLGNITIVADGFAAPITAGNFVDLSIRNFYTGLPVKMSRKKVGSDNEFEVASLPILGSFQEGFYDPLTGRLRRIPLEIIRLDKGKGVPKLSYAEDDTPSGARWDFSNTPASVSKENGKSLLSFNIPGLVALNHPDKSLDGGSSEFFCLQLESLPENKRQLLDGEYAPFGYIVDGYDLFLSLVPGDIIENTYVDEVGQLNLVKLRQSSFSEVVQGSAPAEKEPTDKEPKEKQPAEKDAEPAERKQR